eukprot:gnl/TRDRNA2_/TRDRNA2_179782_c0_seq1.p1 gnl/TRDRNA2_/TRDRNA2_179782_c0~~gnl/TRDRNA2_/TRDRNA2_179782_c0_seq1.p1  ORF type:complete len:204 (-),score=35.65 gnl/TRDRNA2_/TRDRNA2_179782_c0_seq1:49-660(-)
MSHLSDAFFSHPDAPPIALGCLPSCRRVRAMEQKKWNRRNRADPGNDPSVSDASAAAAPADNGADPILQPSALDGSEATASASRSRYDSAKAASEPSVTAAESVPPPPAAVSTRETPKDRRKLEPCRICLEGFDGEEGDGGMPRTCRLCNNNFHQTCLAEWSKTEQQLKWEQKPWMLMSQFESGSCPTCRSNKGHEKARRWKK